MRYPFILVGFILCFCLNSETSGQTIINGIVRSSATHENLGFASVGILGTGIGTITNEVGVFSLVIPVENAKDSLRVSYIGYNSVSSYIQKLKSDTVYFDLDPVSYQLGEVVVLPPGVTPQSILSEVLKRIPQNYARKPFYQQAFYREIATLDNTYTRLLEAAIEIQDFGYDADAERRRVKVLELRKSDDFIETNWMGFLVNKIYGSSNDLLHTLDNCDWVKKHYSNKGKLPENLKVTLKRATKFDGTDVFIIEATISEKALFQTTTLTINNKNYAILQVDDKYGLQPNPNIRYSPKEYALFAASYWETRTIYKKLNDKYYMVYCKFKKPESAAAIDKEQIGKGQQFMMHEIMANNTLTARSDWDRVKSKERQIMDKDIYKQSFKYHPAFWANYTILLRNPLLKQVITDLTRGKTLEEQFYNNGE